jgi:hypothetical protein
MHSQTGLYPGDAALDTKVVSIWMNWCKPRNVHKEKKKPQKKKPQKKKPPAIKVSTSCSRALVDYDHNDSRARVNKSTTRAKMTT